MHQNAFGGRATPGPAGGAYSAPPDPWLDLKGLLLRKGEEREGYGRVGEGKGGERTGRDGTMTKILVPICLYCLKCTKFGQLFLRKVTKTDATRCLDFSSKCTKMRLAAGLCPDPLGELTAFPQTPKLDLRRLLLRKGEEREG